MNATSDSFALLLSHEYTEKSIQDMGAAALKGMDRARFSALDAANAFVSPEKRLLLFIAQLKQKIGRL